MSPGPSFLCLIECTIRNVNNWDEEKDCYSEGGHQQLIVMSLIENFKAIGEESDENCDRAKCQRVHQLHPFNGKRVAVYFIGIGWIREKFIELFPV